jgi:hypothetical protein
MVETKGIIIKMFQQVCMNPLEINGKIQSLNKKYRYKDKREVLEWRNIVTQIKPTLDGFNRKMR